MAFLQVPQSVPNVEMVSNSHFLDNYRVTCANQGHTPIVLVLNSASSVLGASSLKSKGSPSVLTAQQVPSLIKMGHHRVRIALLGHTKTE